LKTLVKGKKGLIMGITNEYSIGYGIAKILKESGAEICLSSHPSEKVLTKIQRINETLQADFIIPCDVSKENDIEKMINEVKDKWGTIDFIVHAIAFSDKEELRGNFTDTSLSNFLNTMHISCYSFIETAKHGSKILNPNSSLLTLSYFGANKYINNYNIMGVAKSALETSVIYLAEELGKQSIRVNSISAGPIKTLAANGIADFNNILEWNEKNSALRKNITQQDIAKSALYLVSDLSSGVTGENHFVDNGYNIIGMKLKDNSL
jgi:enoyl-[acyl-carrier protein] reductase I